MTTQEAIAGLLESISSLSRNDLGRLAQMHSWAQMLAEAEAPTSVPVANEALGRLATGLYSLLEKLILDEAADPDAGLALVPEIVQRMSSAHQSELVDVDDILGRAQAAISGDTAPAAAPAPAPSPEPSPAQPEPPAPPVAEVSPPVAPAAPSEPPPPAPEPVAAAPAAPVAAAPAEPAYVQEPLKLDLDEREHLEGFLEEADEHMDNIEAGLMEVEQNLADTDKLNELFRPFHTIKGIAGFLGLRDINCLTHEIETILDQGRKGELQITSGTVDLIFAAVDVLKAQLAAIRKFMVAPTDEACPQPEVAAIIAELQRAARGEQPASADESRARLGDAAEPVASDPTPATPEAASEGLESAPKNAKANNEAPEAAGKTFDASIRVDTGKLDALVDAVGELVIAQSMVSLSERIQEDDKLARNVSQVSKIVRDVQETAMGMRMVPIGHTFQKMRRLVRDVSRKAGKQVALTINGEETELDKNVIQQISDPLVHLVRNAVDHGVEAPEVRQQVGKPVEGQVELNAFHQGDSIVIEIRDDGKGLDKDKLIAKGIERGLILPEDQLSEQQTFALILQAGFSTADQITDISGRGVGMDVVKRNVEQLRGKIEIESVKGQGSCFRIRLPLTLAIIDGMLVRVGSERLIIPTILIEQSLQPEQKQITSVQRRGEMVQVRGELCPLIQLGALFNYTPPVDPCGNLVVIAQCEGQKIALVVEELIGQQQVVIKTLGDRFKHIQGVSGAAILGDGKVGLILEPSGLLALHNANGCATFSSVAASQAAFDVMPNPELESEFQPAEPALDAPLDNPPPDDVDEQPTPADNTEQPVEITA